jgi:hypothetical protein
VYDVEAPKADRSGGDAAAVKDDEAPRASDARRE